MKEETTVRLGQGRAANGHGTLDEEEGALELQEGGLQGQEGVAERGDAQKISKLILNDLERLAEIDRGAARR